MITKAVDLIAKFVIQLLKFSCYCQVIFLSSILKLRRCDILVSNFRKTKNLYFLENFAKFLDFSSIFLTVFNFSDISLIFSFIAILHMRTNIWWTFVLAGVFVVTGSILATVS